MGGASSRFGFFDLKNGDAVENLPKSTSATGDSFSF